MWSSTLSRRRRLSLLDLVRVGLFNASLASSKVVPFLQQSFSFDWTPDGQNIPIPVTEQCQTIHIKWLTPAAWKGPNPAAPYYLQVYTSSYTTPFIISAGNNLSIDWQVPFAPGTIYQICMFDTNGNTGGCQAMYTMIPSSSNATCANITQPTALDVQASVINGQWSPFGWIDQCTDLSVVPKNGTPPYTLTIAPSLHPPYNITSNTDTPLNWTVSLSWAMPFFVSVVDGNGQVWANGPLHSGGGPFSSTGCLSGSEADESLVKPYIAIASGGGGLLLGLIVGALIVWCFLRKRKRPKSESVHFSGDTSDFGGAVVRLGPHPEHDQYRRIPTTSSGASNALSRRGLGYQVEPFMPDEEGRAHSGVTTQSHTTGYTPSLGASPHHLTYEPEPTSPSQTQPQHNLLPSQPTSSPPPPPPSSQVYVVHHDSQAPPVTIYHQQGTQIVELPPRYPPNASPMFSPPTVPDDAENWTTTGTSSELRTEPSGSNAQNTQTLTLHQPRHVRTIRKLPVPESPQQ